MDKEIIEIIEQYFNSKDLRKFSDLYYPNYDYAEEVKSIDDMKRATMGLDATLNYYFEQTGLTNQDIEILERRVAEYEFIVAKIFSESKEANTDFTEYHLRTFIESIYRYYGQLDELHKIERTEKSSIGFNF